MARDVIGQETQAGGCNGCAGRRPSADFRKHALDDIIDADDPRIGAALCRPLGVPVRRDDERHGPIGLQEDGSRAERLEARQHHHGVRLLDEMGAVMQADEKMDLLVPHAGADVGEALVEVHTIVSAAPRIANGE